MKTVSGVVPIIAIDREARRPLHQQVYEAYRAAIADGTLRAAQKVPSTRVLAVELGVSRFPVLQAYAQLVAEGYLQSRVGSGTEVSRSLSKRPRRSESPISRTATFSSRPLAKLSPLVESFGAVWRPGVGAFVTGQVAEEHFPTRVWNTLVARHARRTDCLDYGDVMGLKDLREVIAVYLRTARGVKCEADQIMVVSGSQQALAISTRVLLDEGDAVWMEEPGYRFARSLFALCGCRVVPVPVDAEGLNVSAGIRHCHNAGAVLVTPSHQYPLGAIMSAARRFQLLEWARRSGAWILEDDYDSEYRYATKPIASLQGLDPDARVIYIGTFNKVLFPSLRLAYMVVPAELVERFRTIRFPMDLGPPNLMQAIVADFIREGHFSRHIGRLRTIYGERSSKLIESLRQELPLETEVTGGKAGVHLTVLIDSIKDLEVAERAARQKLWLSPISPSYMSEASRQGFILGFGSVSVDDIPKAVRKLRAAIGCR